MSSSSPNPFINLRRSLKDAKDCREEMFIREGRKWKIWTTTHMCPIKNWSSTIGGRAQKNRLIISDISLVKKWAQRVTMSTKITQKAMKFSPPSFCTHLVAYVVTCYHDNSLAISFAHFHLFYERVYDKRTEDFFPLAAIFHICGCIYWKGSKMTRQLSKLF